MSDHVPHKIPPRRHRTAAEPKLQPEPGSTREFHVCMGLNACAGQDVDGTAPMAGMGECATVAHVCHGGNDCRGQGGCGYLGSAYEQSFPGEQSCKWNGSCASPINAGRVTSAGPNKGKSVWKLARALFETRMYAAGIPFGPSIHGGGIPDDEVPRWHQAVNSCG